MRLLLMLVCFPAVCVAQSKIEVAIYPADSAARQVIGTLAIPEYTSDSTSALLLARNIVGTIYNKGYLTASIESLCIDASSMSGVLFIGKRFKDGNIDMRGIPQEALAYANFKKRGKLVTASEYIQKRGQIISFYENNGHPFASILLDSITITDDKIQAVARLEKNAPVTIQSIEISGDIKINPDYLSQHIGIFIGRRYDQEDISTISQAVNELAFAEMNGEPRVLFEKVNEAKIIIPLRKRTANKIDGLLGLAPNTENDNKIMVTGQVTLALNNVLGLGENINVDWQKTDAYSQELSAGYSLRYILGTKLGNDFDITLHKEDTTYLNTDITFAAPYYFSFNKLIKIFVENKSSTILSSSVFESSSSVLDYSDVSTNLFGAGTKLWDFDYFFNPRRGYIISIEMASGKKKISENIDADPGLYDGIDLRSTHIELNGQLGGYIPASKNTVVYIENKSAHMESGTLLSNELYQIGGTKTLRGFDEGEIPCSSYSIFDVEYRYLFQKSSNVYIFWNGGYYENNSSSSFTSGYPYGLGCGLNIQNKQSIFTISYAVGTMWGDQLRLNSAKIHFGYINKF